MKSEKLKQGIERHPKTWYYALIACATAFAFLGTNSLILAQGRELVWTRDALPLYTNFLIWAKDALAQAAAAIGDGQGFVLPQYTYSMGYGADVPASMGGYLQDPLNLIPLLLPDSWIGFSYALMTYVRMLLAACTFSWFCFARGHGRKATGIAAIAYTTCGFVIILGALRHPKFMDWAILLPMILLGADRLFQKKSPVMFIVAMILQFVVSIYFSYMSCVVLLVYCLIKYFLAPRERSVRDFCTLVGTFAACGVLAFLVSGIFSVPQVIALLSQNRATSGAAAVPLLYSLKYYAKVAAVFIGAAATSAEATVVGALGTIGAIVLVTCRARFSADERRPWLVGLAICVVGVLVPFLGHVMNGMGYATDRWALVLSFVCAYILCMALPRLFALDRREWRRVSIAVGIFAGLSVLFGVAQLATADGLKGVVWPLSMAVVFVVVFIIIRTFAMGGKRMRTYLTAGISVIICASLTAVFYCSPFGDGWATLFPESGGTWKTLSKTSPGAAAELIEDEGLWRYSVPRVYSSTRNSPLIHGVMGVDYYTSYYNQSVDNLRQELGVSDHHMNFSFAGSDSRLAVEDLAGVKYYLCKEDDVWRVPYGFVDTGSKIGKYFVFRNENAAPLAYIAHSVTPRDDYEALSMTQKQEALLQTAVVDETALDAPMAKTDLDLASEVVEFEVTETEGMDIDARSAQVYKKGAKATIRFKGLPASETYLSLENLGFTEYSPSEQAQLNGRDITLKTRISDALWTRETTYPITARIGDRSKAIDPATPSHIRYGGKVNWIFNLGYSDDAATEMTIQFDEVGDYTFDSMQVICQPTEPVVENVRELATRSIDDVELKTNAIRARTTLADDAPAIAVFSFAHTPGWSVTVDGKPATALKVNTAFLGVELSGAGEHVIEWSYTTPGTSLGALMSAAGVLICLASLVVWHVVRKRKSGR